MMKKISSLQHPYVKHLFKLRHNRDYREEHNSVVIVGSKIVSEVCPSIRTKSILASDETLIPLKIKAEEVFLTAENVLQKISGLQNPEGIIAEIEMPPSSDLNGLCYVVALDGISDPGNTGTLLRTALALGWQGAFIVDDGCDPYNDKALRAAMGATFRLPLGRGGWEKLEDLAKINNWTMIAADARGTNVASLKFESKILLVLGNEARGISEHGRTLCIKASIPMPGEMESLNVAAAGAVLMYALKK